MDEPCYPFVVCGGRDIDLSVFALDHWLELLGYYPQPADMPRMVLVEGGARGVDRSAWAWAQARGYDVIEVPADWEKYGKAAGPIRNGWMADEVYSGVAFMKDGSRGTADMIRQMGRRGKSITTVRVEFLSDDGPQEWVDVFSEVSVEDL